MSQIEQEIKHNIAEGKSYTDQARKGVEGGLKSFGRLAGDWIDQPVWVPAEIRDGRVTGWRRSWEPRLGARPGLYSKLRAYLRGV